MKSFMLMFPKHLMFAIHVAIEHLKCGRQTYETYEVKNLKYMPVND